MLSETGQMAVCCQTLMLGAFISRSTLSVLVEELFKKFCLFLKTPRNFEKHWDIKFRQKPCSGRVVHCGQTDRTKLIVALPDFVDARENVIGSDSGLLLEQAASVVWPLVPKIAGSLPVEAVGIFWAKNPQHVFLRKGSKAVCPVSQICGMLKNPIIYRGSRKL
jgi:hypothetical protein